MNKRILVVDDDRAMRSLLQEMLEEEAYTVDTANDGVMAWEKLVQQPEGYGAILLDVQMPRMDGLQLLQVLREQRGAAVCLVIMLSANSEALHQAQAMGVSYTLEKPFDMEVVLALVAHIISRQTNLVHSL